MHRDSTTQKRTSFRRTRLRFLRTARGVCAGLALVTCTAAAPATAIAQDKAAEAATLFETASKAFEKNDFTAAASAFDKAYRLMPHGATIFNAGLAWEAAGEKARAADAYLEALTFGGLNDTQTTDASKKLKQLEKALGRVEMRSPVPARVSVLHLQYANTPLRAHLPFGMHIVRVDYASGATRYYPVQSSADPLLVELRPDGGEATSEAASKTTAPRPSSSKLFTQKTLGWISLGGAAAFSGAAIILGLQGWSARDEFVESGSTNQDAHDRAVSYRTWANVSWVGAGLLGATGGALLWTAPPSKAAPPKTGDGPPLRVTCGLGPGTVSLFGAF
ncbi:MAG: hypothetical protein HY898_07065 [Deltaproteobacteria bacterium]|nr:hypothetical protein [Deltaproteobacteria bacterium]